MTTSVRAGLVSFRHGLTYATLALAAPLLMTVPAAGQTSSAQSGSPQSAKVQQPRPMVLKRSPSGDVFHYTFQRGDTLFQLADTYMTRPDGWRSVLRMNRIANPRSIPAGTVIALPLSLLKADNLTARTVAFRGSGTITPPNGTTMPLAVNLPISPGMVVTSGPGSFITLQLSNGSRITLPSHSRLRITQMRRIHLGDTLDFDFMLEKGRLETEVTPLKSPNNRYRIRTPIAVSAVRGTIYRVAYDGPDAPSLTEVIEGSVAVSPGLTDNSEQVDKGFGASLTGNGQFSKQALLPPPELLQPGRVQTDPEVRLTLAPVTGATRYHAQLSRDAGFVDIEHDIYADTPELHLSNIDNGRWFTRLTAISPEGMEGMPINYSMRRVLAGLNASAEQGDDGGYRFRWSGDGDGQRFYHFNLRPDTPGAVPLIDETGLTGQLISISDLPAGTYIWRVGVQQFENGEYVVNWLPEQKLIVASEDRP